MICARLIDKNGMFVDTVMVTELNENLIEEAPSGGLYWPKWNGKEWVEGKTPEEIEAIKASAPQPEPDELELLKAEVATLKSKLADIEKTETVKAELIAMKESIKEPIISK